MEKISKVVFLMLLTVSISFLSILPVYSSIGDAFMISQSFKADQILASAARMEGDLNKAADLISQKGVKAFPEIRALNQKENTEIFVADPLTGEILVAPKTEYKNDSI